MVVRNARRFTYLGLFVALFLSYLVLRDSTWQSSAQLHTVMEAVATFLALLVGVMALVRFYSKKTNIFLLIGTGFLGTGLLDVYHAAVTSSFFSELFPSTLSSLIPWSWTASRLFLSVSLWLSWLGWRREPGQGEPSGINEYSVYLTTGALTVASFLFFAFVPLPRAYYPELFFHRPEDLLPGFFFLLALAGCWRKGHWKFDYFEYWMMLSLIVGFLGQVLFMSFSGQLFDPMFDAAHLLKILSYCFVLTGLLINTYQLFRRAEESTHEIAATNKALQVEITQHRRAEQEIRALARFPDENPSPVLRATANGAVLYTNKAGLALLKLWKSHSGEVVPDFWRSLIVEAISSGSTKEIDVMCGEIVYYLNFAPIVDAGYVNIYGTDITKRKRAEEKIKALASFSDATIDSLPGIFYLFDEQGSFLRWNKNFERISGYSAEEISKARVMDFFDGDDKQMMEEKLQEGFAKGQSSAEADFVSKDGSKTPYFFTGTRLTLHQTQYLVGMGIDISERKQAQSLLEEYSRTLEQKVEERTRSLREKQTQLVQSEKMAALGNLVAGVAHEINTPLGAMYSNNDIVSRSVSKMKSILQSWDNSHKEPQYPKFIRLVEGIETTGEDNRTAAERIMSIVASLKSFARLDRAFEDRVDIHDGLESTLTLVHHQIKNRITVHKDYGQVPHIRCYPNQLNQIYMNILVNAIQAIEGTGHIYIKTYTRNKFVVIEVTDTGVGIPVENLNRLSDPGFTTKGVKVGTGLGLSIVHRIIQDHNGEMEVESELGKGSTFRIILPIR